MRSVVVRRQLADDELAAVTRLLSKVTGVDGSRPLSDHLWLDLVHGGRDGFAALLVLDPTDGGDRALVAYAQLSQGNDSRQLEVVVDRAVAGALETVGPELLARALDVVAGDGGGRVVWWVHGPSQIHEQLARGGGMRPARRLLQMRRPLPTGLASGIETRSFEPGRDDDAWLAVNNRAFAGHAEQGGWDVETLHRRQREPWFDPQGFRLHERDGRLAGFCWTKLHDAPEPLGEIYVIGVDPDFHGLGLGKALTLAGLESIADRGIRTGMLFVDDDNSAARSMYERLGFTVHRTDVAFVGDVEPESGTASGSR